MRFLHTLAMRLGRTVDELRHTLSPRELAQWMAYDRESPLSLERHDFHAAQIVAAHAGGRIGDYLPRWGEAAPADAPLERLMGGS